MAEAAIFAALQALGKAVTSEVVKRAFSQSCSVGSSSLEASVTNINRELRGMQDFIDHTDIHDQSNLDQVTWVNEVRELANEIEDTVAELLYLIGSKKLGGKSFYVKTFFTDPKLYFALKRVATELQEAEKSIKGLAETKQRWGLTTNNARISKNSNLSNEQSHNIVTMSAHFVDDDNIVGIEDNRAKLTKWLNYEDHELSILSVWGMGGVGKTTLVTNVFKSENKQFDCNAWITISQTYTVENILRSLISEVCDNRKIPQIDTPSMDIRQLKECVIKLLTDKKYLIVLDDIWNPTAFQQIRDVLVDNYLGSRIMITSRDFKVACLAQDKYRLQLKPLVGNQSWDLFCRNAFPFERNKECPSHLRKWATKIVAKCDGLPLALVSLGNMLSLSESTEIEWKRVHDQLTWELDNNPNLDGLKTVLNLSFTYLPRYLKNCFLYCSLFPEDFLLARKKLIRLWICEGFIEEKGRSSLEEVAEGYLNELIYRNLLQVVVRNHFGRVKRCRMHDTLRELAISLCTRENFGKIYNGLTEHAKTSARWVSIGKFENDVIRNDVISLPRLRAFTIFDLLPPEYPWLSKIFDKSRYIRVLNLEGSDFETIPTEIGNLFNLHYLGLRRTKVKFLPKSIKKLHNLQTLDLFFSQIQKLPSGIVELRKLCHFFAELVVDSTYRSFKSHAGMNLSKGMFKLKELKTLQSVESNEMVVKELSNLTELRSLRIWNVKETHSAELCRSLSNMKFLSYLCIGAANENEFIHLEDLNLPAIQKLCLYGRLEENMLETPSFQFSREGVQTLRLGWSQLQNDPLPSLSVCRNITWLFLQGAYEGKQLTFQEGWFPKLKRLDLYKMPNLIQVEMTQGTMVSLEEIILRELNQLVGIPKGVEHLVSLKWMGFKDMSAGFGGLAKGTNQLLHFTCHVY